MGVKDIKVTCVCCLASTMSLKRPGQFSCIVDIMVIVKIKALVILLFFKQPEISSKSN